MYIYVTNSKSNSYLSFTVLYVFKLSTTATTIQALQNELDVKPKFQRFPDETTEEKLFNDVPFTQFFQSGLLKITHVMDF